MYEPSHFKVEDRAQLHAVIRQHPLATLVTVGEGGLLANPVPFILHADEGENGVLRAHLARPNAQWKAIAAGAETLVIFTGVERYVTPAWYATKQEHGKVVPTWNYVTVQVRGPARTIEDPAWLRAGWVPDAPAEAPVLALGHLRRARALHRSADPRHRRRRGRDRLDPRQVQAQPEPARGRQDRRSQWLERRSGIGIAGHGGAGEAARIRRHGMKKPDPDALQTRRGQPQGALNYEITETLEAGIALQGTEVKSLRGGKATIGESYAGADGRPSCFSSTPISRSIWRPTASTTMFAGRVSSCCIAARSTS